MRYGKKFVEIGAIIATCWAGYMIFLQKTLGRVVFTNYLLPRQSFDPFLKEIPEQVRDDVFLAYERGIRHAVMPFLVMGILWFICYCFAVTTKNKHQKSQPLVPPNPPPSGPVD
jgi:hypothetical protein